MKLLSLVSALTGLLAVALLTACESASRSPSTSSDVVMVTPRPRVIYVTPPDPANAATEAKLQKQLPAPPRPMRLHEVADYLRDKAGLNIVINEAALEAMGLTGDDIKAVQLKPGTAESMLKQAFEQPESLGPLGFTILEGVVYISSRRHCESFTDVRIYPLPVDDLHKWLSIPRSTAPILREPSARPEEDVYEEYLEQITTLIQDTVGRQYEWATYGGDVSSLAEIGGALIVRTGPANHAEIEELFVQLFGPLRFTFGDPPGYVGRAMQEDEVRRFLSEAERLRLNERYAAALVEVDRALLVAPQHPQALAMRRVLQETLSRPAPEGGESP